MDRKERNKNGEKERDRERNTKGDFLGVPTVEARRSEKKSQSTHREIHVDTKILEFRQTLQGRKFSYLNYFYPKGYLMAWAFFGAEIDRVF